MSEDASGLLVGDTELSGSVVREGPVDPGALTRWWGRFFMIDGGEPVDVRQYPDSPAGGAPLIVEFTTRDGVLLRCLKDDLLQALARCHLIPRMTVDY